MIQKPSKELIHDVMSYVGSVKSQKKIEAARMVGKLYGGRKPSHKHYFVDGERGGRICRFCKIYETRVLSAKRFKEKQRLENALLQKK